MGKENNIQSIEKGSKGKEIETKNVLKKVLKVIVDTFNESTHAEHSTWRDKSKPL